MEMESDDDVTRNELQGGKSQGRHVQTTQERSTEGRTTPESAAGRVHSEDRAQRPIRETRTHTDTRAQRGERDTQREGQRDRESESCKKQSKGDFQRFSTPAVSLLLSTPSFSFSCLLSSGLTRAPGVLPPTVPEIRLSKSASPSHTSLSWTALDGQLTVVCACPSCLGITAPTLVLRGKRKARGLFVLSWSRYSTPPALFFWRPSTPPGPLRCSSTPFCRQLQPCGLLIEWDALALPPQLRPLPKPSPRLQALPAIRPA